MRVLKNWNRLLSKTLKFPSLKVLKACMYKALINTI